MCLWDWSILVWINGVTVCQYYTLSPFLHLWVWLPNKRSPLEQYLFFFSVSPKVIIVFYLLRKFLFICLWVKNLNKCSFMAAFLRSDDLLGLIFRWFPVILQDLMMFTASMWGKFLVDFISKDSYPHLVNILASIDTECRTDWQKTVTCLRNTNACV